MGTPRANPASTDARTPSATDPARPIDDSADAGRYDAAGTAEASSPDATADPRPTRFTLEFRTVTQGGKYAPHNGGVAWVEDDQGKWVHTFEIWLGDGQVFDLRKYFAAGGPNYAPPSLLTPFDPPGMGPVMPPADVISSATLLKHRLHAGDTWDLRDANGNEVPDGHYSVVIEVTEDADDHEYEFPFEKTARPFHSVPPDIGYVIDLKLNLQ